MKCSLPLAQFSLLAGNGSRNPVPRRLLTSRLSLGVMPLVMSGRVWPPDEPCAPEKRRLCRRAEDVAPYQFARASVPATRHSGGFTLIELLVVIAVIAILAGLTLSTLGYANKKGADSRAQAEVAALSAAIESYKLDVGVYPADVASLYSNLCPPVGKVYFEPRPQMLKTNGSTVEFADPWDNRYEYTNFTNYFELWSTANTNNPDYFIRN